MDNLNINPNNINYDHIKRLYVEFKHILSGCDTILDALNFANIFIEKYPDDREMIFSLVNGQKYMESLDINTKQDILNDIHKAHTKEDALEIMDKLKDKNYDDVYKRTMVRLSNRKYNRPLDIKVVKKKSVISKNCPHCGYSVQASPNANYVICGYSNGIGNKGIDWDGCGRDWCFQCGKILCKKWHDHGLYLEMNRMHNDECCVKHSKETGKKYPEDYCQCSTKYISRSSNDFLPGILSGIGN